MNVPYGCYFSSNLQSFFMDDRLSYITHEAIFSLLPLEFQATLYIRIILCETTLSLQMQASFVVTK